MTGVENSTDRYYKVEPAIRFLEQGPFREQHPDLVDRFLGVFEAWYEHQALVSDHRSTYLKRPGSGQDHLWQIEVFGNYLYGALLSFFCSWEHLQSASQTLLKVESPPSGRDWIDLWKDIHGSVRNQATALDALVCCLALAEETLQVDTLKEAGKEFKKISLMMDRRQPIAKALLNAYGGIKRLRSDASVKDLVDYRHLLTHRPFIQLGESGWHLPKDFTRLQSVNLRMHEQGQQPYMKKDVFKFVQDTIEKISPIAADVLVTLEGRYRFKTKK